MQKIEKFLWVVPDKNSGQIWPNKRRVKQTNGRRGNQRISNGQTGKRTSRQTGWRCFTGISFFGSKNLEQSIQNLDKFITHKSRTRLSPWAILISKSRVTSFFGWIVETKNFKSLWGSSTSPSEWTYLIHTYKNLWHAT